MPVPGGGEDGGATPAPVSAPDSSTTNVQEAGVDEPDIVKTDDGTVFAVVDDALRSIDARSPGAATCATSSTSPATAASC